MARKIFKRAGLRRDKNFSDVANSKQALNSLLDSLVSDAEATFISEDLDPIRNIFTTGITPEEYQGFIGSSVKETSVDGFTNAVIPAITYQNRLDNFRVTSGEPRLSGGNGLTAKYFNQDQVENTADIFTGITTGGTIPNDTFWEAGNFEYTRKIHPQSVSAAGGVQWEGFFIPSRTGVYTFSVSSTLGYTVDFETEGYTSGVGTYTEYGRVQLVSPTNGGVAAGTFDASNNTITMSTATAENMGVGMTVTQYAPASGSGNVTLGSLVEGVNRSTGVITIESGGVTASGSGAQVGFGREIGKSISTTFNTYPLQKFRRYRIRFRTFVPSGFIINRESLRRIDRRINFTFKSPAAGSFGFLRYNNLFSLDYDFSDGAKGDINKFLEQSVLFGGNKEDGTERIGGSTQPGYVRVETNKKVDVRYQPKQNRTQVERKTINATWDVGATIIPLSDTTNIEIGNYVFASTTALTTNVHRPVRVIDIVTNQFIIVDTPAVGAGTNISLTFVDHRGFVKRVSAYGSGNMNLTSAASNPRVEEIKVGQIAIYSNSSSNRNTKVTEIINDELISYTPATAFASLGSPTNVYFYESRGLIDRALNAFCVPAQTKCFLVTANATAGDITLQVNADNINFLSSGNKIVQGFPFADGTQIASANVSAQTITVSPAISRDITAGSRFTVTTSSEDRTLCCPPTDTSPPFTATETGLKTNLGTSENLRLAGGNLIFDNLTAIMPEGNISALTPGATNNSTKRIELKGGDGVVYNLLCE